MDPWLQRLRIEDQRKWQADIDQRLRTHTHQQADIDQRLRTHTHQHTHRDEVPSWVWAALVLLFIISVREVQVTKRLDAIEAKELHR